MKFFDALMHLNNGARIRRHGWMPGAVLECPIGSKDLSILKTVQGKESTYPPEPWCPKLPDLWASDWEIHVPRG